jgi:uncharacterized membrane protein YeaQ/YmgE (transglycosylase-associated protein family)
MINLIIWIVLGGLAGWLASIVTGRNQQQGCLMNVIVGVIGASVGGLIYNLLTGGGFSFDFNFDIGSMTGFLVAVGGAIVLLLIVNLLTGRGR